MTAHNPPKGILRKPMRNKIIKTKKFKRAKYENNQKHHINN